MIDRESRNKLAELLRGLASGALTNDQFEDSIPHSNDRAIMEVFDKGGWLLYSDMKEYRLKGKDALSEKEKKEVARWVLFLKSEYEYKWPNIPFNQRLLHSITFGVLGTSTQKAWSQFGEVEAWPFRSSQELSIAKGKHGYLGK
jgi:hypothetical protein